MHLNHILVVDDDAVFRMMLETFLKKNDYKVTLTGTIAETLKVLDKELFDLVLIDLRLPDGNGLELLKEIRKQLPKVPLILLTSFVDVRTAVKAIKSGAFEYITKPINPDELLNAIKVALKNKETINVTTTKLETEYIQGKSAASLEVFKNVQLVAPTNMSVMITGESGTGKEYVARSIHFNSRRFDKSFLSIDCGVLSSELAASELFGHVKGAFTGASSDKAGYFEASHNGTIFLDEIGNLSKDVQIMLLRVLQERKIRKVGSSKDIEVNVRVIAATNEDLKTAVLKGNFREDLYHRLNEFSIYIPPLRERKDDIMEFAYFFLKQANKELERDIQDFDKEVEELFLSFSWPGNLREFRNVIKRSVLLTENSKKISREAIPSYLFDSNPENENSSASFDLKEANYKQEKEYILKVLEKVKYNKSSAARILNIDRKTLYNKLKQFQIDL